MLTIAQRISQLQQMETRLPGKLIELAKDYGNTSVALVKEESIEKGINRDGQPSNKVSYLSKPVRDSSLIDAALNSAGRAYAQKQPLATYYGLRQAQGMQSPNVTLQYSGLSWKGYKVISVNPTASGASVLIGATGEHAAVFFANIKRYGAFYKTTPEHQQRLRSDLGAAVHRWFTKT